MQRCIKFLSLACAKYCAPMLSHALIYLPVFTDVASSYRPKYAVHLWIITNLWDSSEVSGIWISHLRPGVEAVGCKILNTSLNDNVRDLIQGGLSETLFANYTVFKMPVMCIHIQTLLRLFHRPNGNGSKVTFKTNRRKTSNRLMIWLC